MTNRAEQVLAFLRECHSVMSKNYDNSLTIPTDIVGKYEQLQSQREWFSYLKYKFRYMLLLETQTDVDPDAKIFEELVSSGISYLKEFVPQWKAQADNDRIVCFYRYCQLPEDVVEDSWYYQQIEECYNWCKKRKDERDQFEHQAQEIDWHDKLLEIYGEIGCEPFADCHQEHALSVIFKGVIGGLVEKVESMRQYLKESPKSLGDSTGSLAVSYKKIVDDVSRCFDCFKDTPLEGSTLGNAFIEGDFLINLSLTLMETLHSTGFDETAVIGQFLQLLKEHFGCEVCDFLDVADDNTRIVWKAATVNHKELSPDYQELSSEELRKKILERESYGKGIGISGSILLVNNNSRNTWYHIGSNDVTHDPRQSKEHRSAYENDMYPGVLRGNGLINNFWMFPIFEGHKFIGAFRVVNKIDKDGRLEPGGWPYFMRFQLALVSQWFSRFLKIARPQMQQPEDYVAIMERSQRIEEILIKLNLSWVAKRLLQAFLRHLIRNISKKQEKRSLGCCIIMVNILKDRWPLKELRNYPLVDVSPGTIVEPYDALDNYHDAIDPLMGAHIFDQNGKFIRIARLEWPDESGKVLSNYQAIERITKQYNESLCLLLPRDTKNILIYQGGRRAAEVHLSEGTGKWRFRYPQEILDLMVSWAPTINHDILEAVCNVCIKLSFEGLGAIIVVGDIPDGVFRFSKPRIQYKDECDLSEVGESLLVEFAKMDGATFISKNGLVKKVNRNVTPISDPGVKPLFPGRGTRHETAEKISKLAPDTLVMVVSENRGISVIASGGEKVERDI